MKKIILTTLLLLPMYTFAAPVSWDGNFSTQILQPLQSLWSAVVKASSFTSTSTTVASIFPYATTTYITASTASTSALVASNSATFSFLGTGLAKITSGVLGLATAGVDYQTPLSAGTDYEVPLTFGDALTRTANDIDFDGGATPAGDLGGTWASPSVTDDSHAHTGATLSGIDISSDTNLTAGDGLTLTDDDLDCDTASGSVFGCLTSADWTTFNNKLGSYDAWTHSGVGKSATTSDIGIGTTSPGTAFGVTGDAVIAGEVTGRVFKATSTAAASVFPYASSTALTVTGKSYVVGSAVATAPNSVADLIINDSSNASIQLIGGTTGTQYLLFGDTDNDVGAISYDHNTDLMELTVGTANIADFGSANIGLATSTQASTKVEIGGTQLTSGGDNGTGQFLNLSGLLSFDSNSDQGSMIKIQPTVTNSGTSNTFFGVNVDPRTITNTGQISNYASYRAAEETTNTFGTSSIGYLYGNHPGGTTDYAIYTNSTDASYFGGKVGIGSTTPSNILSINSGTSAFEVTTGGFLGIGGTTTPMRAISAQVSSASYKPLLVLHNNFTNIADGQGTGIEFYVQSSSNAERKAEIRAVSDGNFANNLDLAFWTGGSVASKNAERFRIKASNGAMGIGTTTPVYALTIASNTPQLALSAGAGFAQWVFRNAGGNLLFATTTVAGNATTSTSALTLSASGVPSMQIGSSTPQNTLKNGSLVLGGGGDSGGVTGSTTIQMAKIQIDGQNSAGARVCVFVQGTTLVASSGACTP